MSGQLRKAINIKGMLKRRYDTFKTQTNKIKTYRKQCNLVTKLKHQSMGWYLNKNCKNNYSGENQQTKTFCTVSPFMSENGKHREKIILR